jgi:hypothetical protein
MLVIPEYFNFVIYSKDLLSVFVLLFYPAFWSRTNLENVIPIR